MKKVRCLYGALFALVLSVLPGITVNAAVEGARQVPHYDIREVGGIWDGTYYYLADGTLVKDAFFCDGTYTYYLMADGTPMTDRLTYHPDGEQIIYFDAQGHECFDTFANVKKSISGEEVDDLCYFGSTGNLYVNVITYNREGTAIYYANPYGVMERNGAFELDTNAINYELLAKGCHYGYANSDGSVRGFYVTYDEATKKTIYLPTQTIRTFGDEAEVFTYQYDANGNLIKQVMSNSFGVNIVDMIYDEQNRLVKEICTDGAGNLVDYVWMNDRDTFDTHRNTIYEYNANGVLSKKTQYNVDGTIWQEEIYSYDENGNLIKAQYSDVFWDYYIYDSNNKLIKAGSYYNGKTSTDVSYKYDENGNMVERWGYVSMTGGFPITYFGENGLPIRTAYRNKQGDIIDSVYDEYDSYGNVVREVNGNDVKTYQYTYDANGNMTSKTYGDNQAEVYGYDEHGNLILEQKYENGVRTVQIERAYISMRVNVD